ncbi:IS605 family transposase, partial [Fusobacterium animalis ATCC 51191]
MLIIPYSNSFKKTHKEIAIKLPPILKGKKIKEIRIIPKQYSRYFEIQYTYEVEEVQRELNKENGLGIDLGIDNLCTCVTNNGASFLIDGRKLKSINQYYNK